MTDDEATLAVAEVLCRWHEDDDVFDGVCAACRGAAGAVVGSPPWQQLKRERDQAREVALLRGEMVDVLAGDLSTLLSHAQVEELFGD